MKGLKITLEFNKLIDFSREEFEEKLQNAFLKEGILLANFWCVLDKRIVMSDFPVIYFVNECIIEIDLNDDTKAVIIYKQAKSIIEKQGAIGLGKYSVSCMRYEVINIKSDKVDVTVDGSSKVFVTGVTGQLGHDVMNRLYEYGYEAIGSGLSKEYTGVQDGSPVTQMPYISLDIMDSVNVEKIITEIKPMIVIHCAAWNKVEQAEDKNKMGIVRATNADGTQSIADACAQINAKLVYISTDYIFEGSGVEPWEADSKEYKALNVYGQTKLEGELAVSRSLNKYFIVRTSWAYGINGKNFVKTMLDIGKQCDIVKVVSDQIGTPTYTKDLANLLVDMIDTEKYGFYNATNEGGYVSWYDFACEIFKQADLPTKVLPVSSNEYGVNRAVRPYNSRLDKSKLAKSGFKELPDWKDALHRYLKELEQIQ